MINLEREAARVSQAILKHIGTTVKKGKLQAKDLERLTTNALAVLQEQGLYAFFLYLFCRSGAESEETKLEAQELGSCIIVTQLMGLVIQLGLVDQVESEELRVFLRKGYNEKPAQVNKLKPEILELVSQQISTHLNQLLLVKTFFERVLIYTRYGAKAITSSAAGGS